MVKTECGPPVPDRSCDDGSSGTREGNEKGVPAGSLTTGEQLKRLRRGDRDLNLLTTSVPKP